MTENSQKDKNKTGMRLEFPTVWDRQSSLRTIIPSRCQFFGSKSEKTAPSSGITYLLKKVLAPSCHLHHSVSILTVPEVRYGITLGLALHRQLSGRLRTLRWGVGTESRVAVPEGRGLAGGEFLGLGALGVWGRVFHPKGLGEGMWRTPSGAWYGMKHLQHPYINCLHNCPIFC